MAFMKFAQVGPAMAAPVRAVPRDRLPSSKPYQTAVVMYGENPTVHASSQFCVVPVFAAKGWLLSLQMSSRLPWPPRVPSLIVLCRMLVMM